MKKPILIILSAFVFLTILVSSVKADDQPWQERINKDGIVVSTRKVVGAPVFEFKAAVTVAAPLDQVIALYENGKRIPEWYYQCAQADQLKVVSPTERILYTVMDLPWPVAKRDVVFHQIKSLDAASGSVNYALTAVPEDLAPQKGKIRVPYLKSTWRFTPIDSTHTEVYFQQHSSTGGSIPAMITNALVLDIPFQSLKAFRKLIEAKK